jgi:signal transduction histidine kinase
VIQPHHSLRARLLLTHLLVIAAGVGTLLLTALLVAPHIHNRLMAGLMEVDSGMMSGTMMTGMNEALAATFRSAMVQALLLSASAAIFAAVVVSLTLSARIVTPIERLLTASRRIAAGHYAERVPEIGRDELGALAVQFNIMAVELEGAERRRVALIGDVAHELRTPLATIEGYAEGLLDGVVEPSAATWVVLHDEVGRLRRLVSELQELSRAEARQLTLHRAPISPAAIVAQAVARIAPQFVEKGVTLAQDASPHLPLVRVDADRIIQVLINLLGNALRYTPEGGAVTIRVAQQGDTVVFSAADTGIGVAPEHLPQLFERFYRVDKARSRTLGGSGIGLTIAKALVEAHGGRIWAESAGEGQGTTFTFSIPTAVSE